MATTAVKKAVWAQAGKGAILPIATLVLVGLMVVPVPAALPRNRPHPRAPEPLWETGEGTIRRNVA